MHAGRGPRAAPDGQTCAVSAVQWSLVAIGVCVVLYVLAAGGLYVAGRRSAARGLASFIPDLVVLVRGLLRDPRVLRGHKVLLGALLVYLLLPFDIVPDFVPLVGALDDVLLVALVLRYLVRGAGSVVVEDNWHGPRPSLALVLRAAGCQ